MNTTLNSPGHQPPQTKRFRKALLTSLITGVLTLSSTASFAVNKIQPLPFGQIKPQGWMATQMSQDINGGFVGHLDELVPDLIKQDDIYGEDRLTKLVKHKSVGTHTTGDDWEVQFLWWNSETQSNWWDGYLRNVLLTADAEQRGKIDNYINEKLATQDEDGYIGIYGTDLRFDHSTENGELWAQSSLFRGMLAYYEATGNQQVLDAVVKAIDVTMAGYPIDGSTPYKAKDPFAGVGHGLTFTDVLNDMTRITGDGKYLDYAVFLYEDYNRHPQPEEDIHVENLLDEEYRFKGHGVHTYEHLRALAVAAHHTKDPELVKALGAYLEKLETVLTASGGPIGDEWVGGRHAHHSDTGYEYCSLQELLHSYAIMLHLTGEAKWAERMEWILYNAAQGARNPDGKSIAYCKTDNAYHALGHLDMDAKDNPKEFRFKYSPAHQDVAVCCAPNAGRIYPYFVQNMWQTEGDTIVTNLYGPASMQTQLNGSIVSVEQQTNYPFSHRIKFNVTVDKPANFAVKLRKPSWASQMRVVNANVTDLGDYLEIRQQWSEETEFTLTFVSEPQVAEHTNDTIGVSYGPLLFALPLDHQAMPGKQHDVAGFTDLFYKAGDTSRHDYQMPANAEFKVVKAKSSSDDPWAHALSLSGQMYDPSEKSMQEVELVPMGNTILRKVSFETAEIAGE